MNEDEIITKEEFQARKYELTKKIKKLEEKAPLLIMALSDAVKTQIPYELIKSISQAYGITVENHPRSNIIVGTTNAESGFLRDITGNRRFWPVEVAAMAYDAQKEALECGDMEGIIREYVKSYRWLGKVIVKQNWENKICFIRFPKNIY
ncbi:VapE domain-containing protein [Terrisporobacter petrolearius]|uniref:VapE domain-containing protein n=1 Tax=Terrisporobacter petrolearius TaxID=1460447 RepID=UPI003AFF8E31